MLFRRLSLLAILALSLGTTVALADANPQLTRQFLAQNQDREGGQGGRSQQFIQELGLSPQQAEQMRAIRNKFRNQIAQQRQALKQAEQELRSLIAGTASADVVRQKHDEVRALRQQIEDAQFSSLLEIREIMTPEQRAKFAQMMQNRRGKSLQYMKHKKEFQD